MLNEPENRKVTKVLAHAGHGSRREIESYIEAGRISIDGKTATLGDRIDVNTNAKIRLDGRILGIKDAQKTRVVFWRITSRKGNYVPATTGRPSDSL